MLKLSDNPPMLSPWVSRLEEMDGRWWVAHTKARFEKAFAWDLLRAEVACFLPLAERVRYSSGKKRRVLAPLFPSYVFFNGDDQSRLTALGTQRLCQAIEVLDQDTMGRELDMIHRALCARPGVELYTGPALGERCRVAEGPFLGVEGKVVEHSRRARVVLEVSLLGQGAVIELDADLLEVLA